VASVCRKIARKVVSEDNKEKKFVVTAASVPKYLGPPKYISEEERDHDEVGVATGLAWTQFGGEILSIEVTMMPKQGGGLILTGSLGEVMKESAHAALSYLRSKAATFGIDEKVFARNEIHIHVPQGAIPKDGPSAGITIATALLSLLTGNPIRRDVAMTGEVTLRGKVLAIGGVKEKTLAALRHGIKDMIVPARNEKDLEDVPKEMRKRIKFHYAKDLSDALQVALLNDPFEWAKQMKPIDDGPMSSEGAAVATPRSAKSIDRAA